MLFSKKMESLILFAKGFTRRDGEMDVDGIFGLAGSEARGYAKDLFHACGDPARMRVIVDYLTYFYDRHRYRSLKRKIFEIRKAIVSLPEGCSLANLRLAGTTRNNLRVFEMGFIGALNRQMDVIEMYANAGLDREEIAREMHYSPASE